MAVISEFPLQDFDEKSDSTDSETELLLQRVSGHSNNHIFYRPLLKVFNSASVNSNSNNSDVGGSGNSVHYKWPGRYDNSTRYKLQRQPSNFLSQLFGAIGGGTAALARVNSARFSTESSLLLSSSDTTDNRAEDRRRPDLKFHPPSKIFQNRSSFSRDDLEYRSYARLSNYAIEESNASSVTQAARFGHKSRTYHVNSPLATTSMDVPDASPMGTFNYNNDSSNTSAGLEATNNNCAPTATANSVVQTIIDPENGSKTIFYQNNRRKSKQRSLAAICKMCFCR